VFFIDDVIVRRGAIGSGFMAGNASEPFDPELLRLLAQKAANKLN